MKKLQKAIITSFILAVALAQTEIRDILSCKECFDAGNAMCRVTNTEQDKFFCKTPLEEEVEGDTLCSNRDLTDISLKELTCPYQA